jgi:hypothetical protein
MSKQRKIENEYDFVKLKAEFFASEFTTVKSFWNFKFADDPKQWIMIKTKGWAKKKQKWKEETGEKTLLKAQEKMSEDGAKALINLTNEVIRRAGLPSFNQKLTYKEIGKFWEILRTVNNLPYKITKNLNKELDEVEEAKLRKEAEKRLREANVI